MSSPQTRQRHPPPTLPHRPLFQRHFIILGAILILSGLTLFAAGLVQYAKHLPQDALAGRTPDAQARLSDAVSIQAQGRGNPTINLSDGHELLTSYVGREDLRVALEENDAVPLSLTSADFDEDGVPDLISGYGHEQRGIITLLRGNVDAIYPNAPEARQRKFEGTFTNAPFLSPARSFDTPFAADFIGAGDFDADGHWDVVAAQRGGASLTLLAGDGRGSFAAPKLINLPGVLTAFTTGEVNRADGLPDVVVGVDTSDGPAVLVFESPNGALSAQPEVLPMVGTVDALALGQLDNGYEMDLAVGAGARLEVVSGRDRKLSLPSEQQQKVLPAQIESRVLSASIKSLVIGDFTPAAPGQSLAVLTVDGQVTVLGPAAIGSSGATPESSGSRGQERSVASSTDFQAMQLVRAKVSSLVGDDLMIVDANDRLHLLAGATADGFSQTTTIETAGQPITLLPMRLNGDALTDLIVLQKGQSAPGVVVTATAQTFVVNSTADTNDGACTSAPNGCTFREAINASNNTPGADTINFNIPGSNFTITPLNFLPQLTETVTVDGTTQPGFQGAPIIELNGTSVPGFNGLFINSINCLVRGLVINRFSGAPILSRTNGVVIEGNYLGVNVTGNAALTNGAFGILMSNSSSNMLIGGTTTAARNVISGFTDSALLIGGTGTSGVLIQGNFIGTDSTGQTVLSNGGVGINLFRATNSTIGGTTSEARNVFGGWAKGVAVGDASTGVLVQGNYVGTNVIGTSAVPNTGGVFVQDSPNNTVGGTLTSARNLISGNRVGGVTFVNLNSSASGNLIQGNFIGTNVNGTGALANGVDGVLLTNGPGNTVGGTVAGAMNLISGNGTMGVTIGAGANDNQVLGNLIGTDITGTLAVPNGQRGVFIKFSNRNRIGGTTAAARNVISGNLQAGVRIYGGVGNPNSPPVGATDNAVQGNFIGTDVTGTQRLGNGTDGVQLTIQTGNPVNIVGGASPEMRNIISGNGGNGVAVGIRLADPDAPGSGGTGITIQNNYIGTDLSGNNCIGNTLDGVFVDADSAINTISDNLITCNGRNGVFLPQNSNPAVRIFVDNNSIFANTILGIDLGAAGITANDVLDTDTGANFQQNFPVLTSFSSAAPVDSPGKPVDLGIDAITVNATLNSTPNTAFTVHWYFSSDAQCATNQQTSRPLVFGKVPGVTTDANGNASFNFPFDFPAAITNGIINCTATDPNGNTSEFSACLPVNSPPSGNVQFTSSTASVTETLNATTKVDLTVTRTGSTAAAATVNYATANGSASERSDYMAGLGTVRFAVGESSKTVSVFIVDDRFGEGAETFSVSLSNPVGLALASPATVTVTINSNESVSGGNPVKNATFDTDFFVRIQYLDFFNREADAGGLNFWKNQIDECTTQSCREVRRVNVSAAFFVSIEFQETGYLVYKTNQAAYNAGEFLKLRDFLPDLQEIGRGVIIGQPGWEAQIEANKTKFFQDFVQRSKFTEAGNYPTTLTAAQFVDKLNANTYDPRHTGSGGALTQSQRDQLVAQLSANPSSPTLRAQTLRTVSENAVFNTRQFNKAFVLMQYFGYLRRNPNDPPEAALDFGGYNFWLGKLNQFNGNYIEAEMVRAFITSGEYEQRFGP